MRLSEALRLDARADVLLDYGYLVVRRAKNDHERVVHLPRRTLAALSILPNAGEPGRLIRTAEGEPYTLRDGGKGGTMIRWLARAVADAGLDPAVYTAHTFRHSWATWFYAQTRDVMGLRTSGGWRTISQCERYTHLAAPGLAEEALEQGWDFRALGTAGERGAVSLSKQRGEGT